MAQRGRPRLLTDEERADTAARYRRTIRNVTMDAEVAERIGAYRDRLSRKVGFEVTISQALTHLLKSIPVEEDDANS